MPTPSRTAAHSRSTAASMSSLPCGKNHGRFHWPTSSKIAPCATCHGWIEVVRTGSKRTPSERPASEPNVIGWASGRALEMPTSAKSSPKWRAVRRPAFTFAVRPCSVPVPTSV